MQKSQALASLGQRGLLMPVWVKAALAANDRLKVYLTVLQAAATHADHPDREALDLARELDAAGLGNATWLHDLPSGASCIDGILIVPELDRLISSLADDLATMARPVLEACTDDAEPHLRVHQWQDWLDALHGEQLEKSQLHSLTHGDRHAGDSVHLLIMDLHKQINHLAASLASEVIDGAHVWQLNDDDRPLVSAFMRGLNRTAPLKLDHPGLDTAATRDGELLLLQNDIGTNDAHVLVMRIKGLDISLTYSDLHSSRFAFFQSLLAPLGASWSATESRVTADLNQGAAYSVGTARFACQDEAQLAQTLEGLGASIVFLIDWNRARKRLLHFVSKEGAIAVLTAAAHAEVGHMAWLKAGGERLVFNAMQTAGAGAFRIGDRLDDVLGDVQAQNFLLDVMRLASEALLHGQPLALIADETRLLLSRQVQKRTTEFDLLDDHAAYCQALAQAVSDGLAHGHDSLREEAQDLAARAKAWERRADHLVMQARQEAERQPRWQPVARLMALSDDVADALEEAAFMMSLIADHHQKGWNLDVRQALSRLAQTVLQATQDHIKALAIARTLGSQSDASDSDAFLAATWNVLRAERQCDELLRQARRVILHAIDDAPSLMLANDLAMTLELASDRLLAAGYGLRELAFDKAGAQS
ncbi:MAG TPA: phosphate transport regulator [Aquabacterium sp.]|uniref:phosphate transport regulator n=1 Tax=Aquabacterium sp. TaxID=1872578 RepID=UPI002E377C18|nr:phosphate transport regulator [Aquabacterium sp.]HEX5356423.1 phosphate transport regulator [Aquabacterium sp.]